MFNILCVTNRSLCRDSFLRRIEKIAASGIGGIILREKDLSEEQYAELAAKVMKVCETYQVPCVLHSFIEAAIALHAQAIHLPLPILRRIPEEKKRMFSTIGSSCHSLAEAEQARQLGCTYLTFGQIFRTDCKKGMPPRGVDALSEVCEKVSLPVLAIGGIQPHQVDGVKQSGASGICLMSGLMTCQDVERYLEEFEKAGQKNDVSS